MNIEIVDVVNVVFELVFSLDYDFVDMIENVEIVDVVRFKISL